MVDEEQAGGLLFSLSSTPRLVACAIASAAQLGVDVEVIDRPAPLDLAGRLLAAGEVRDLERQPPERRNARFYGYWTLKEAYLKGCGVGVATLPRQTSFRIESPVRLQPAAGRDDDSAGWRFQLLSPTPFHAGAVAARWDRQVALEVVERWWQA